MYKYLFFNCNLTNLCYNIIIKGNRHRVVDLGKEKPSLSGQSTGKVFYVSDCNTIASSMYATGIIIS